MSLLLLRFLISLLLFYIGYVYGGAALPRGGNDCTRSDRLYKGFNNVTIDGTITCGGKALYAAYIQMVDNFQAVNDVIGHGHSDREGKYNVKAPFFYYSDTDLAPPKGSWKIIIYSYCGISFEKKNHCHRVTKHVLQEDNNCLQWNETAALPYEIKFDNMNFDIPLTPPPANKNDKSICLQVDKDDE